jgi:homospermidine synthase
VVPRHGVRYINTSVELWDPYDRPAGQASHEKHAVLAPHEPARMTAKWKTKGPTAVLEHGANPGLISHFTKQGLLDIGKRGAE